MPVIECAGCGRMTNTAVSNHLFPVRTDGKATCCYLAFEGDRYVKGCAYDDATPFTKGYVDYVMSRQEAGK